MIWCMTSRRLDGREYLLRILAVSYYSRIGSSLTCRHSAMRGASGLVNSGNSVRGRASAGLGVRNALHRAGVVFILVVIAEVNPLLECLFKLNGVVFSHPIL